VEYPGELEITLNTIMEKIINDEEVGEGEGIIQTISGVDLMPANLKYSGMELALFSAMNRERILEEYIIMMRPIYDFIILDCQPTLGLLTINALTAADSVLVPVQAEKLAVDGLQQLIQAVGMVRRKLNRNLTIEGVLFTMVSERTRDAKEVMSMVREAFGSNVHFYEKVIPATVKIKECSGTGYSILDYDPNGKAAQAYMSLTKEVLSNE
jgi:chromosome partitioning protein